MKLLSNGNKAYTFELELGLLFKAMCLWDPFFNHRMTSIVCYIHTDII